MIRFADIAEIHAGYPFRGAIPNNPTGNIRIIQFKDYNSNGKIDYEDLNRFSVSNIKDSYLLKKGDILVSSRGSFKSAVFDGDEDTVAVGILFVATLTSSSFLPEYVSAYLNSAQGQAQFMALQNVGLTQAVTRAEIERLEIPIIPLEIQKKMSKICFLYQEEQEIMAKLLNYQKSLIESAFKIKIGEQK